MATRQIFIKKIRRFLYDGASFFQWVVETDRKPVVKGVFPLSINKFNSEGYYDPTAFEAVSYTHLDVSKRQSKYLSHVCKEALTTPMPLPREQILA